MKNTFVLKCNFSQMVLSINTFIYSSKERNMIWVESYWKTLHVEKESQNYGWFKKNFYSMLTKYWSHCIPLFHKSKIIMFFVVLENP